MERPDHLDARLAAQVQQLLLPKSPPVCDWSCIAVKNVMADGLGGDFFDFLPTVDGCHAVMIGDVTGHGISASVVMGLLADPRVKMLQAGGSLVEKLPDGVFRLLFSQFIRQGHDRSSRDRGLPGRLLHFRQETTVRTSMTPDNGTRT